MKATAIYVTPKSKRDGDMICLCAGSALPAARPMQMAKQDSLNTCRSLLFTRQLLDGQGHGGNMLQTGRTCALRCCNHVDRVFLLLLTEKPAV